MCVIPVGPGDPDRPRSPARPVKPKSRKKNLLHKQALLALLLTLKG